MLEQSGSNSKNIVVSNAPEVNKKPLWHEVKSEDGKCYFWNTVTNGIYTNIVLHLLTV